MHENVYRFLMWVTTEPEERSIEGWKTLYQGFTVIICDRNMVSDPD